jgi:quercetin dioxygenase-like cupin family protein
VKLARALGVRLGSFLDDQEELGPVVTRAGESRPTVRFAGTAKAGALDFRSLAAGKGGRHMEPFLIEVLTGSEEAELSSHEGEEFIYVLSGSVEVAYGTERRELAEGDSIYYDSIVPHRVAASGPSPARILAVVYAPL